MIPTIVLGDYGTNRLPRTRGDDPAGGVSFAFVKAFAPHARG